MPHIISFINIPESIIIYFTIKNLLPIAHDLIIIKVVFFYKVSGFIKPIWIANIKI